VIGVLFGRRIRVTIGNLVVCDVDPALPEVSAVRSLDVAFSTEAHTLLSPMSTTVTVLGLNRIERTLLTQQQQAAKALAWEEYQKVLTGALAVTDEEMIFQVQQGLVFSGLQVLVEAGYEGDFSVIANAQTMPDGIKHDTQGVPTTTVTAQDGRYPWQNGFVSQEMAPGVTYMDWALIEQLSEGVLDGSLAVSAVATAAPELLARKNFAGYLNGRVLEGDASARVSEMAETLGLRSFFDRGEHKFIDPRAYTLDEACVLKMIAKPISGVETPAPGGMLSWTEQDRGFLSVRTLLNHRLTPGRQVLVFDELGVPIGAGVFRCDYVRHSGSTYSQEFNSEAILRPVTISLAANL
jgi:hypothetical protein